MEKPTANFAVEWIPDQMDYSRFRSLFKGVRVKHGYGRTDDGRTDGNGRIVTDGRMDFTFS